MEGNKVVIGVPLDLQLTVYSYLWDKSFEIFEIPYNSSRVQSVKCLKSQLDDERL